MGRVKLKDCINISRLEMHKKENNPFWRKTQENLNHQASFPAWERGFLIFVDLSKLSSRWKHMKSWRIINLSPAGRVLPIMAFTWRLRPKGVLFQAKVGTLSSSQVQLYSSWFLYLNRELNQRRRRRQRERQKTNRFRLEKWQFCTCITLFVHFFAVVTRLQRKSV